MNIAISGASGFIGRHLSSFLAAGGHRIIPLGRAMFRENMSGQLSQTLSRCEVLINLAGAPINRCWTPKYKRELYDSRVHLTHKLVKALHSTARRPSLFISASAVGYYPNNGVFDEYTDMHGSDYLSRLCYAWEKEALKAPSQVRLVIARFAVVLASDGGALQQMLLPLRMKVAAAIGPGSQPFPWVDMRDVCRLFDFIIRHKSVVGPVNVVAPQVVTQREFSSALAAKYHAWLRLTVPAFLFRLLYGEGASFLTTGQRVLPTRLLELGFTFESATVGQLFDNLETYIDNPYKP